MGEKSGCGQIRFSDMSGFGTQTPFLPPKFGYLEEPNHTDRITNLITGK